MYVLDLDKIKKLRNLSKLSQLDMVEKVGFKSVYAYHRKESGKQPFHADEIHNIARFFNKQVEYFFSKSLAENASDKEVI